ncbi:ATP-binding cassette domain-containing protein [Candidatus Kuenenbacteria bacterium]|nr:ATP-binding cassette domain-containing protein [Candidatus Kuenenbacteria bacterium]
MQEKIIIKGAREHNLKNISLELPRNKMIVFTGLSGSGKSSLAFDTIFAEGQRRYIESLSAYARQFLGGMQKPDVDEIDGLSPAISIDQKAHSANPRSTVATITEIYDYLRVLYARIGEPHCPLCHTKLSKMTADEMAVQIHKHLKSLPLTKGEHSVKRREGVSSKTQMDNEILILSPVVRGRKGEYYQMLYDFYNSGFLEVRVDGKIKSLRNRIILQKNFKHTIEVIVDRIPLINTQNTINKTQKDKNNPNYTLPVTHYSLQKDEFHRRLNEAIETAIDLSNGLCTVIYPDTNEQIFSTEFSCPKDGYSFPEIEPRLFSFNSPYGYCEYCTGLGTDGLFSETPCPKCHGKRLNNNALAVKINNKNIWDFTNETIGEAYKLLDKIEEKISDREKEIAGVVLNEIRNRLQFMLDVGLHYISLNRKAGTLSGGEAQRIRLASQVGTRLVGALYVLDEPTIGLHQRDNEKLVNTLRNLADIGNTIIVVEHDEDTILMSDWIVDIGPGAGVNGGEIIFSGPTVDILKSINKKSNRELQSTSYELPDVKIIGDPKKSLTGQYLRRELTIPLSAKRRKVDPATPKIKITGASENNLKNINVEIPLRRFVCLTGVSGSGKSTLMDSIIYRTISNHLNHTKYHVGKHKSVSGTEYIDKIIEIDQSPIGRTPRSNPATYTKAFDEIRNLFAMTPEARMKGYGPGRFSFNVPSIPPREGSNRSIGGRCEKCEGRGTLQIEMHFLPSVEIICDACRGQRFNKETLAIHYKNKNISDILNMTIAEAEKFFKDIPFIYDKLKVLNEVGLDYLTLGQSATTLSGGEAQRIKLSRELAKRNTTKTLYLLDEPTTGLHYDDVRKLIAVLQRLVDQGNTVLVIEHNLDVIKCADWIVDLGPEGGDLGGELVFAGTPEQVAQYKFSYTGEYLRKILK